MEGRFLDAKNPQRKACTIRRCKPLLIATWNPDEGPMREHLLDRIAVTLSAGLPGSFEERLEAVKKATMWRDNPQQVIEEVRGCAMGAPVLVIGSKTAYHLVIRRGGSHIVAFAKRLHLCNWACLWRSCCIVSYPSTFATRAFRGCFW